MPSIMNSRWIHQNVTFFSQIYVPKNMVETMFEKYNFVGVFIRIQVVLTLYAQGAYRAAKQRSIVDVQAFNLELWIVNFTNHKSGRTGLKSDYAVQ
ncbi:hypothetical protein Ccrd_017305, partial [Cynara cardunculus var. scolymus]